MCYSADKLVYVCFDGYVAAVRNAGSYFCCMLLPVTG
jgi:hypothetical protein